MDIIGIYGYLGIYGYMDILWINGYCIWIYGFIYDFKSILDP